MSWEYNLRIENISVGWFIIRNTKRRQSQSNLTSQFSLNEEVQWLCRILRTAVDDSQSGQVSAVDAIEQLRKYYQSHEHRYTHLYSAVEVVGLNYWLKERRFVKNVHNQPKSPLIKQKTHRIQLNTKNISLE